MHIICTYSDIYAVAIVDVVVALLNKLLKKIFNSSQQWTQFLWHCIGYGNFFFFELELIFFLNLSDFFLFFDELL